MRLPKWTLFRWYKGVRKWCKCGVVDPKTRELQKRKTGVKPVKTREIGTSQFFHKFISTHLLTVLTASVIVQIEQRRREMNLKSFVGTQHFGFSKSA